MPFEVAILDCNLEEISYISISRFRKVYAYFFYGELLLRGYLWRKQVNGAIRVELSGCLVVV